MEAHLDIQLLLDYLKKSLSPGREAEIEAHLESCEVCNARLMELEKTHMVWEAWTHAARQVVAARKGKHLENLRIGELAMGITQLDDETERHLVLCRSCRDKVLWMQKVLTAIDVRLRVLIAMMRAEQLRIALAAAPAAQAPQLSFEGQEFKGTLYQQGTALKATLTIKETREEYKDKEVLLNISFLPQQQRNIETGIGWEERVKVTQGLILVGPEPIPEKGKIEMELGFIKRGFHPESDLFDQVEQVEVVIGEFHRKAGEERT